MSRSCSTIDAVQVRVDEILSWRRSPVAEQAGLDVRGLQRLAQQRVVEQIDLADRKVVGRAPVGIDAIDEFGDHRHASTRLACTDVITSGTERGGPASSDTPRSTGHLFTVQLLITGTVTS